MRKQVFSEGTIYRNYLRAYKAWVNPNVKLTSNTTQLGSKVCFLTIFCESYANKIGSQETDIYNYFNWCFQKYGKSFYLTDISNFFDEYLNYKSNNVFDFSNIIKKYLIKFNITFDESVVKISKSIPKLVSIYLLERDKIPFSFIIYCGAFKNCDIKEHMLISILKDEIRCLKKHNNLVETNKEKYYNIILKLKEIRSENRKKSM